MSLRLSGSGASVGPAVVVVSDAFVDVPILMGLSLSKASLVTKYVVTAVITMRIMIDSTKIPRDILVRTHSAFLDVLMSNDSGSMRFSSEVVKFTNIATSFVVPR